MQFVPSQTRVYHSPSNANPELGTIYRRGNEFCIDALVTNAKGLHLRPSAALAEVAAQYPRTSVTLEKGDTVSAIREQMDIISCDVQHGTRITFTAAGPNSTPVLNELYRTIQTINHRNYDAPESEEEF